MASGGARLVVAIITDASKASKDLDKAADKFGKFGSTMSKLQAPAAGVVTAIAAFGVAGVNAASDLQQAMGGVDAVFGDSAATIKSWAADASQSVGLSAAEYSNFAATIGAQLKNLGVPFEDVAGNTNELIALGADLAATYGGTTADAVAALSSALRGEADPAERYGLALNATAVNAELAAQGLDGLTGDALTAAKAQTIMGLATEQAGGAIGQFSRESDTAAGQSQRMTAALTDATAELGAVLLPIVSAAAGALADMAKWVQENSNVIVPLVAVIGTLAAGILAANAAMNAWSTIQAVAKGVTVAYTAVQQALNVVMAANPIGIVVTAVLALVAAFIWLWNNVEGFRNFFIGVWEALQVAVKAVADWFVSAWGAVSSWFTSVWEAVSSFFAGIWAGIRSAFDAVAKFFRTVWNVAVAVVQAYFRAWYAIIAGVIRAIRSVIQAVVNWFKQAWSNAVKIVSAVIKRLQSIFKSVFDAIMVPINAVINAFQTVVSWIKQVINWLSQIKVPDILGSIGGIFGASAPAVQVAPMAAGGFGVAGARLAPSARAGAISSSTPTINITVNGGLDSGDAIARQIERVLTRRSRRSGGITIGGR